MIEPGAGLSKRQTYVVFGGVVAGMFLAALDANILGTALPTIVNEFKGGKEFAWVATMYLLTSTAVTPLFGKLSDQYGRRGLFQFSIVIFVSGSVLCALAQNMAQLIGARGIQGIGGGGLTALAFAIIGDVVPPRERGRYVGILTTNFTVASIIGPLLGGVIVDHTSWRWIFLINVPLGVGALIVTSSALKLDWRRTQHQVDYVGASLLVAAVTALILAMVWSGTEFGWLSSTTLGLLATTVVLAAAFLWWETKAPEPIVPMRLFRVATVRVVVPVMFLSGAMMYGAAAFIPLYLQAVTGVKPTWTGVMMSPFALGVTAAAIYTGRHTARTGLYKRWPIVGLSLLAAGMAALSFLRGSNGSVPVAMVGMALAGAGIGATSPVGTMSAQNAVDWKDLGTVSSVVLFFRQLGAVIGLALFGGVLNARLAHRLDPRLVEQPLEMRKLPAAERHSALDVFTSGITTIFRVAVPLTLLGLVIACFLPELSLRTSSALDDGKRHDRADADDEMVTDAQIAITEATSF